MIFKQLFDQETFTYTYLMASDYGREALIIDPVKTQMPLYAKLIAELGLKLVFAIDTHIHADHITAIGPLQKETGCQTVMGEHSKAQCVTIKVKEDEIIHIDKIKLKPIYTPGHTDDSYCFLLDDKVFTGDTLLIRSTGRTDFQNGDSYAQYDSLFNKLLKLPDRTMVYPAHDYHGQTSSTIWGGKKFNPRLKVNSAEEYAKLMGQLNMERPKYIDIAVPANLRCGFENSI